MLEEITAVGRDAMVVSDPSCCAAQTFNFREVRPDDEAKYKNFSLPTVWEKDGQNLHGSIETGFNGHSLSHD